MATQKTGLAALREYMESEPRGRKLCMDELKALSAAEARRAGPAGLRSARLRAGCGGGVAVRGTARCLPRWRPLSSALNGPAGGCDMLSDHARRFCEVEIRNERDGGVSPATVGSAIDSAARQAPTDVLADWLGLATPSAHQLLSETSPESWGTQIGALRKELTRLQDRFGSEFRLQAAL